MKWRLRTFIVLTLTAGMCMPAFSEAVQNKKPIDMNGVKKIGVIDVQKVVASSKEVERVKKEHETNKKLLVSYIKLSAEKMNNEKDPKRKEEMKKQFTNELTAKKESMDKVYAEKLIKINNDMNVQVSKLAKERNYDLILTQEAVLYGGDDLTKDLIRLVK